MNNSSVVATKRRPMYKIAPMHYAAVLTGAFSCICNGVQAMQLDVGDPDTVLTVGNTLRYAAGWRTEGRDSAIARSPNTDEGDNAYARGEMVTNRLDLLTEIDFSYQRRFGFRLSGAAWRDFAFNDRVYTGEGLSNRGSYENNRYSGYTRRYGEGLSGEILDAYVFDNFKIGPVESSVKAGRLADLWGEAIALSAHSVSYAQAPSDGYKGLVNPGADAKELALPIGQISGKFQLTPELTLLAQYFYEWKPTRVAEGGTYLGGTDFILQGPDRFSLAPGVFLANRGVEKPNNGGDWGVGTRWRPTWFDGTIGTYYREFTERTPTISIDLANREYRAIYPDKAKLMGISLSKNIGGVSTGLELVHRQNTAFNSTILDGAREGARGDSNHVLLNAIYAMGPNSIWDSANLTGELAYSRWDKVTSGEQYFNRCGNGRGVETGCVTRDAWQTFVQFSPTWTGVWPGWDITTKASYNAGIKGNSAVLGGGNEHAGSYSMGVTFTYNQQQDFSIAYNDYLATNKTGANGLISASNGQQLQDRGWLVFTYKNTFE